MYIEKKGINLDNCKRIQKYYLRARDAMGDLLDYLEIGNGDKVMLPAYIGWSPREGSGVFDPLESRKITPVFYHLDTYLNIDKEDCINKIKNNNVKAIVFIHYFGFVDKNIKDLIDVAKLAGILVIEDAAHAFFTDKILGGCGRYGDYTIYSLHKMLPMEDGGVLVSNVGRLPERRNNSSIFYDYQDFDLIKIANKRILNYKLINEELEKYDCGDIRVIREDLPENVVPQTFPIEIMNVDRYEVYKEMNSRGWGLVSLYHTLIEPLRINIYDNENWVSRHITNLPVHQDANDNEIKKMIKELIELIKVLKQSEIK